MTVILLTNQGKSAIVLTNHIQTVIEITKQKHCTVLTDFSGGLLPGVHEAGLVLQAGLHLQAGQGYTQCHSNTVKSGIQNI